MTHPGQDAPSLPSSPASRRVLISSASSVRDTVAHRPLSVWSRVFITLLSVESAVLMATAVIALVYAYQDADVTPNGGRSISSSIVMTAVVAMAATIGVLFFGLEATVRLQHRFQLLASIFAHATIVAYVFVHWRSSDLGEWFEGVGIYTLAMVVCCQVVYLALAYPVIQSFGRRMYSRLRNSRPELIALYTTSEIFFCLLKIDVFLQLLLAILGSSFVTRPIMIPAAAAAFSVEVACLLIGMHGVRRESIGMMRLFTVLTCLQPAYFLWTLHEVYTTSIDYPQYTFEQMLVTACFGFICRIALLAWTYFVSANFGLGLRERLWNAEAQQPRRAVVRVRATSEMMKVSSPPAGLAVDITHAHMYHAYASHHSTNGSREFSPSDSPITVSTSASFAVVPTGDASHYDLDESIVRGSARSPPTPVPTGTPGTLARLASLFTGRRSTSSQQPPSMNLQYEQETGSRARSMQLNERLLASDGADDQEAQLQAAAAAHAYAYNRPHPDHDNVDL